MELAGVVGMGASQEEVRPESLKYIFVKGQEASEQQRGKATFWVFKKSQDTMAAEAASAGGNGHVAEAVPERIAPKAPTVKQTAVTDFFSRRSPKPSVEQSNLTGRVSAIPPFITPCPSVRSAEVPAVFEVQSECEIENHLDPIRSLSQRDVSTPSSEPSSVEIGTSLANVSFITPSPGLEDFAANKEDIHFKKLSRRYSEPSLVKVWQSRSISDSSNDEASLGSPIQHSASFSTALTVPCREENPASNSASPSEITATKLNGTFHTEDAKTDEAEQDAEKYWIEKDMERLEIIANTEKTMAKMKGELANSLTAFQMASGANLKLQSELEKKTTNITEMEEDTARLAHDLDAAEMANDIIEKDLAYSRRDRKRQFGRAEEALTLLEADPNKKTIANLLQAKAEAESHHVLTQEKMESKIDSLESQLKERCDSIASLTMSLSRVADSDRWQEIKKEMEEWKIRANNLPNDLQAAWLACEEWKGKYENLMLEHGSLKEDFQLVEEMNKDSSRELYRSVTDNAAVSQRSLKGCLKQVFERMIRCSLLLESEGFSPFDRKHRVICEKVSKVTGRDYQEALLEHYEEHDIQAEFNFEEDDDEDKDKNENGNDDDDGYGDGEEDGKVRGHGAGDNVDNNGSEANGGSQEDSRGASGERQTLDDQGMSCEACEDRNGGSQDCDDVGTKTGDIDVASTSTSSSNSGSGEISVSSASVPVAEEVDALITQAGGREEVPESPEVFGAKVQPELGPSKGRNVADLPTVDSTPDSPFATPIADSKAKSGEGSKSPEPLRSSLPSGVTNSSTAGKGSIWKDVSFATADDKPFSFGVAPAANIEAKSDENVPVFSPFVALQSAGVSTPVFKLPKAERSSEAILTMKEKATSPSRPPGFNFGEMGGPVSSTASSPALATQSASPGMFSFGGQASPPVIIQGKKKAEKESIARDEDAPKIGASKEKGPEKETSSGEEKSDGEKLELDTPEDGSLQGKKSKEKAQKEEASPKSELSRIQKRAAKKQEKKAAKKATNAAKNAKAQESRRVQQAMMMR